MNKKIKSVVLLVSFAAGLISGDAVFASSSLEKSKMLIGRGKKNLADAVDKNDVNCDEQLYLTENKAAKKSKNVSNKITKSSRLGPLEILGINGAAIIIGMAVFSKKELVEILQKYRHRGMEKDEENVEEQGKENSKLLNNSTFSNNLKPDSGQVNSTTVKEKPHGNISLWIKENPTVFSLVVTLFTAFLIFDVFFHVRTRRAIKKSNEEIKELNEILDKVIDEKIEDIGKFVKDMDLLENLKNYKAILKKILIGNTDKTLTLTLSDKMTSGKILENMNLFYSLAGRFYDALGGFWYVAYDESDIKKYINDIKYTNIYPAEETKIYLNFFSINDYLTRVRTNFDKIKTIDFYNNEFKTEEKILFEYYYNYFASRVGIPDKECEDKLMGEIFNTYQNEFKDKESFFVSNKKFFSAATFYTFLTNGCFSMLFDDRIELAIEFSIKFLRYAIKKLIEDKDKKYNLTRENKIFLIHRFNALLLFNHLLDCYMSTKVKTSGEGNIAGKIANKIDFHIFVLRWCKENIKSKNSVQRDDYIKNESIFFLARMETAYLLSDEDDTAYGLFGEILKIYENSSNNSNNITNIDNDNNNFIDYLKDAKVNFEQIQFMK